MVVDSYGYSPEREGDMQEKHLRLGLLDVTSASEFHFLRRDEHNPRRESEC